MTYAYAKKLKRYICFDTEKEFTDIISIFHGRIMTTTSINNEQDTEIFNFDDLLFKHKASDVVAFAKGLKRSIERKDMVEIDSSLHNSIEDASNILWENDILGAPVWDREKNKYCGSFDARDVLSATIASAKSVSDFSKEMNIVSNNNQSPSVTYLAARNPITSCSNNSNLKEVFELVLKNSMHRVPVSDDGIKFTNMISQSIITKYLYKNIPPQVLDMPLSKSKDKLKYEKLVFTTRENTPAIEAFELIDSNRLSGLAVVDDDGVLRHTVAARDIKFALQDGGKTSMDIDILSYLAHARQSKKTMKERYPVAHLRETDTIHRALSLLASTGYHRLFVVDENTMPIGVISVIDIIRFILKEANH